MQPRYYQTAANDAAWDFLANKQGNPLIVLPTGAGKSLVIAMLCKQAVEFGGRVVVLQHRKELIQQNAEKIRILIPECSVGVFSAGLKTKQTEQQIICAGIQSVFKRAADIGPRHLIIIDEAHLVSSDDETMYGTFLREAAELCPRGRVVGLTATPFRTGEGPICGPDKMFRRICYEAQTGTLIREGFLSPITNKPADSELKTDDLAIRGGEFIADDMQRLFVQEDRVKDACKEIVEKTKGRNSILVFAAGVMHAEQVAATLMEMSEDPVGVVTGDTFPMERANILKEFRDGRLRWLVNCDVLTTGFDAPGIDAIAILRATMSPGLFAQMVGRGLRKADGKADCLILDFGENIKRHGSLDDPSFGRVSGATSSKQAKAAEANGRGRSCPNCNSDVSAKSSACPECGFRFPANHFGKSDSEGTLTGEYPPEEWAVIGVAYGRHTKRNDPEAPPTLRVDYSVEPMEGGGLLKKTVSEWVCFEHEGFARLKAVGWWTNRSIAEVPNSITEALSLLNRGAARAPSFLTTVRDGKYTRIHSVKFIDDMPDEWPDEVEEVVTDSFGEEVPF